MRQEIAVALKRNIPVTPVLLQGAPMPAQERLPDDLKDLAFRNGFELSHTRWHSDVREMAQRLGLGGAAAAPAGARETSAAKPIALDAADRGFAPARRPAPARGLAGRRALADAAPRARRRGGRRRGDRRGDRRALDPAPGCRSRRSRLCAQ